MTTNAFEIGKKYIHAVNPHCQFVEVIDRTAKTVTIRYGCAYEGGEYHIDDDVEKKVPGCLLLRVMWMSKVLTKAEQDECNRLWDEYDHLRNEHLCSSMADGRAWFDEEPYRKKLEVKMDEIIARIKVIQGE